MAPPGGAIWQAVRLSLRIPRLRSRERDALVRLGESIPVVSAQGRAWQAGDAVRAELAAIERLTRQPDAISDAMDRSLEEDRSDYGAVAGWMRPLVVVRGMCTRAVLRHRWSRWRRDLHVRNAALGRAVLAAGSDAVAELAVPGPLAATARAASTELARAIDERARCLEPLRAAPLPRWTDGMARETMGFGRAVWKQLHGQLAPRASALAGLAAGWWVTSTYTDSRWRGALHSLGIGKGGKHVVSGESYRALNFWLPLLAAALCAYLGDRLAGYIRRRYGAAPSEELNRPILP
jgi:hypothetical protein